MLRFHVYAERTETAVVGGAQLISVDVLARFQQTLTYFLWTLDPGVEGVGDSHEGNLLDAIGILADRLADLLVYFDLVGFGRQLDQKVSCVHSEHGRQKSMVVDFARVD